VSTTGVPAPGRWPDMKSLMALLACAQLHTSASPCSSPCPKELGWAVVVWVEGVLVGRRCWLRSGRRVAGRSAHLLRLFRPRASDGTVRRPCRAARARQRDCCPRPRSAPSRE
jgi:hypothetical protein